MKPTWRRGSPVRTRVRSSPIRDPGAKDFKEFGRECTKNEKEPKKQKQRPVENDGLWKSTKNVDSHSPGKACGFTTFTHRPGDELQDYGKIQSRIVDFRRSKLRS